MTHAAQACLATQREQKPERWEGDIQKSTAGLHHWRRSDTWFSLIRRHAEAVLNDTRIVQEFADNCQHVSTSASRRAHAAPSMCVCPCTVQT